MTWAHIGVSSHIHILLKPSRRTKTTRVACGNLASISNQTLKHIPDILAQPIFRLKAGSCGLKNQSPPPLPHIVTGKLRPGFPLTHLVESDASEGNKRPLGLDHLEDCGKLCSTPGGTNTTCLKPKES